VIDVGELRPRQVNDEEDDQVQVLSNSNVQDDTHQASSSDSYDNVQDQQVASTSSLPNDQASARNQVPTLQPTNIARDHLLDAIIEDISRGVQTRSRLASFYEHFSFVSFIEPKKIEEALRDIDWVNAIHEELNNFTRNQVWELVERPKNYNMIGTKWVFRNKEDQDGIIVRNNACAHNIKLYQMDVKSAFLNGCINEEVYVE
jgi:hypothetical protein